MRISFLLVFLMSLLFSCRNSTKVRKLKLIKGILLRADDIDYPSGSTLNFYKDSLYLMGDDARDLLVLDTSFNAKSSIPIFFGKRTRVRKAFKADIEAGDFQSLGTEKGLLLIGSGSVSPSRDSLFKMKIKDKKVERFSLTDFYDKLKAQNLQQLNIEGAAFVKNNLLLGNRSNLSQKQNYLIVTPADFEGNANTTFKILPLSLSSANFGISGLDYYKKKDILFITFSSEATKSTSADGEIGNSAVALIGNISKKLDADSLSVDAWLPLSAIDATFDKMKIESVAVGEREKGGMIIYLVADNDNGRTGLYKVKLLF